MMKTTHWSSMLGIIAIFLPYPAWCEQALDIQMRLTKNSVLLGEPVWVDVTVTNSGQKPLWIRMGEQCWGSRPLKVRIPEAGPDNVEPERRCDQGIAGDCFVPGPTPLDPGAMYTWRYVLAGDFRITHPGDYHVLLEKGVRYAIAAPGESPPPTLRNPSEQIAKEDIVLKVRPGNPGALLRIEHSTAAEVTNPWVPPPLPTAAPIFPIDLKAPQKTRDDQYAAERKANEAKTVLAEGLAEYPAVGMEAIFDDWMISDQGFGYGLQALYRLNTPQARRLVAEAADPSRDVYLRWRQDVHVADTLPVEKTYVPLLEKLARDDSAAVRQQAVLGLGLLGGEAELPKLIALAHEAASQEDRRDAIIAMGDTDSLKAVPILIDLFALPNADQPASSNLALMRITHHQVLLDDQHQPVTVAAVPALWQEWSVTNEGAAHAFGPFECSEK